MNLHGSPIIASLCARSENTAVSSVAQEAEDGYTQVKLIGPDDAGPRGVFKMFRKSHRVLGVNVKEKYDSSLESAMDNDPSRKWYYNLTIQDPSLSETIYARVFYSVTFYVCLYKKLLASASTA